MENVEKREAASPPKPVPLIEDPKKIDLELIKNFIKQGKSKQSGYLNDRERHQRMQEEQFKSIYEKQQAQTEEFERKLKEELER